MCWCITTHCKSYQVLGPTHFHCHDCFCLINILSNVTSSKNLVILLDLATAKLTSKITRFCDCGYFTAQFWQSTFKWHSLREVCMCFSEMELIQKWWLSRENKQLCESKGVSKDKKKEKKPVLLGIQRGAILPRTVTIFFFSLCLLFCGFTGWIVGIFHQMHLSMFWRVPPTLVHVSLEVIVLCHGLLLRSCHIAYLNIVGQYSPSARLVQFQRRFARIAQTQVAPS